jgi:S-adenosylmethionine/arginine decarboxylase-like enzyme
MNNITPKKVGKHILVNLYDCDSLPCHEEIYEFMEAVVEMIKMKALIPPYIVKGAEHLAGLTGVCIIETSHITMHTFEKNNFIAFDLYSCKNYDEKKVIELLEELTNPAKKEINVIRR